MAWLRGTPGRLAIAVVGLVVVAAACGGVLPDAATVGDQRIERSTLDDQLRDIAENDPLQTELLAGTGQPEAGTAVSSDIAASWLTYLIYQAAVDAEFDARDLEVTGSDRQAAEQAVQQQFSTADPTTGEPVGGAEVVDAFPKSFRDVLVDDAARVVALQRDLADQGTPDAQAQRRFFREHRDYFAASCASGRFVMHVLVDTEAEARQVLDELDAGADFAQVAEEHSQDQASAAAGGWVGCLEEGTFVADFEDAALAAEPDVPVGPVQTDFGFHVIEVVETPPTFAQATAQNPQLVEQLMTTVQGVVQVRLVTDGVTVDPRYGEWVVAADGARVQPPTAPTVRDQREPEPTAPTPSLELGTGG